MTTGVGVAAFYQEPHAPQYPASKTLPIPEYCYSTPEAQKSSECQGVANEDRQERQKEQAEFDQKQQEYQNKNAGYTRTAVFLGVLIGALFAIGGLIIIKTSPLVANGFL